MAKKPVSLLHLHEFLRKVWDERDKSKDDWVNEEEKEGEDGQKKKGGKKESADDYKHGENKNAELGPGSMLSHQTDIFHPDNLVGDKLQTSCFESRFNFAGEHHKKLSNVVEREALPAGGGGESFEGGGGGGGQALLPQSGGHFSGGIQFKLKEKDFSRHNVRVNKRLLFPASGVDAEVQAKVCSRRK